MTTAEINDAAWIEHPFTWRNNRGAAKTDRGYIRFGIPEPARIHDRRIKSIALDLVLLPLVAFDTAGHRLGMGGGYYDHSFEFIRRRVHWNKPRLVGLAYEFQRLPLIEPEPWDVSLDAVATEQGVYHC